jgi:hypothetical protein
MTITARHIARVVEMRVAYTILIEKNQEKVLCKLEETIEVNHLEIRCEVALIASR